MNSIKFYFLSFIISYNYSIFSMYDDDSSTENENSDVEMLQEYNNFFDAISNSNIESVKKLLEQGADINGDICAERQMSPYKASLYPLMLSIEMQNPEIFKLLLNSKADINVRDYYGKTALMYAAYYGNSEIFDLLVKAGININEECSQKETALMSACEIGNKNIIEILLSQKIDINKISCRGQTALIKSINQKDKEIINILLKAGANLDVGVWQDDDIIIAANNRHTDIVRFLIYHGYVSDFSIGTLLMIAAENGYQDIIELAIEAGANIESRDPDNKTALIHAIEGNYTEICELLLKYEANFNVQNKDGKSANKYLLELIEKARTKEEKEKLEQIKAIIENLALNYRFKIFQAITQLNYRDFIYFIKKIGSVKIKDKNNNNLLHTVVEFYNNNLDNEKKIILFKIASTIIILDPELLDQKNNLKLTPIESCLKNNKLSLFYIILDCINNKISRESPTKRK